MIRAQYNPDGSLIAAKLLTASGIQVPVAYQMEDAQLRAHVPGIPSTPLEDGIRKTVEWFERTRETA